MSVKAVRDGCSTGVLKDISSPDPYREPARSGWAARELGRTPSQFKFPNFTSFD